MSSGCARVTMSAKGYTLSRRRAWHSEDPNPNPILPTGQPLITESSQYLCMCVCVCIREGACTRAHASEHAYLHMIVCMHACMCVYACIYAIFPILSIKFFNSCVNCNSCYFYWLIALLVTKCVLPYHCDLYSECDSYTYVYPYNFPFLWYTSNISTCKCILWSIKCAQACGNSVIMHVHSTWQAHKTKLTWNLPIESFTNINFPIYLCSATDILICQSVNC